MHGLADDTFVAAAPELLAPLVADPRQWVRWWPDLTMRVGLDRGLEGLRWEVSGALRGTAEIWLEAVGDGTVVHFYLRASMSQRARRRRTLAWKRDIHALKDAVEGDRVPGSPARRPAVAQGANPNGR
jgi:hypothetical protein